MDRTPPSAPTGTGPRFRSRFGGLWTDLSHAHELVNGKLEIGRIHGEQAAQLRHWIDKGFVVLPNAVPHALIDRVLQDVARAWTGADPLNTAEYPTERGIEVARCDPTRRTSASKLLNLHAVSAAARDAIFAPAIRDFLHLILERPALAFSTLTCERGTQQPPHQDTAYVGVSSPLEFAASWIALEDIREHSGRLEYYVGSHRIPETVFDNGLRIMPQELRGDDRYAWHLKSECEKLGLPLVPFGPRKGDALIWSADLVHGGGRITDPDSTRRSVITHYCPADLDPEYFLFWEHSGKQLHAPGCYTCHYKR